MQKWKDGPTPERVNGAMVGGSTHEPKMCMEYLMAVANHPIDLGGQQIPPLDELERRMRP